MIFLVLLLPLILLWLFFIICMGAWIGIVALKAGLMLVWDFFKGIARGYRSKRNRYP